MLPLPHSIPCCCLSRSKFSCRSWISSLERTIFSGWWYNTAESRVSPGPSSICSKYVGRGARMATIRTDQVSALEVEAIELIACLLGVVYVFVDHKCRALGVVGDTLTNLSAPEHKVDKARG